MHISKLSIRNYRNFKQASFSFQKGVNTIIGENGSGKTNVLHAIRLLIDDSLPRSIRFFESDFNRSLVNWRGHWIIIQIEFSELDKGEESQAIAMHKVGTMDELDSTKGTYALVYRPRENKRKELYDYSQEEEKSKEGLQEILDGITLNDYEFTFLGRGNLDFSDDQNYIDFVGDFEKIIFPNPDEYREDIYGIRLYGFSIPSELSCTFIKALRDVEADLRSYKDNPLLTLLRGKDKTIEVSKKTSIENKITDLNDEITALDEVRNLSQGITESINQAVGQTYAPSIDIKSELPAEMEKLMQSLKLWVSDPDDTGYQGRIWELSLGGANLIYLSLKLLEYEKVKSLDKVANFLLIEEPEAHIHTHIQKSLFDKLHNQQTQIIITTHSTHISSVSKISAMNVLSKSNNGTLVFEPAKNLDEGEVQAIERYLDAVRTNLLFAKGVILVEGDAEQILIPQLVKKILGVSLDEIGVTIVNIGSTGFENVGNLFHDDRVRKNCSIITDLDTSILPLPADPNTDTQEQKDCRNSQISGLQRRDNLEKFIEKNSWIEAFYSDYTFEVDFLHSNNSHEIKQLVSKQYKRAADIEKINTLLDNKDVAISGKEVLRLAKAFGKGWFALLLAEEITHLTYIPDYILQALAHASKHFNVQTLYVIAKYRLQSLIEKPYKEDVKNYQGVLEYFESFDTQQESINAFIESMPQDQFTKFYSFLTK